MTKDKSTELLKLAHNTIIHLAEHNTPKHFSTLFNSLVVGLVGTMPDDYWDEFIKPSGCDTTTCIMHREVEPLTIEVYTKLRAIYTKLVKAETKEQSHE
jgi:hypothetical protein